MTFEGKKQPRLNCYPPANLHGTVRRSGGPGLDSAPFELGPGPERQVPREKAGRLRAILPASVPMAGMGRRLRSEC